MSSAGVAITMFVTTGKAAQREFKSLMISHAFESVLKFRGINARYIAEMRIPTRKKDAIARLDARGNLLLDMVERAFPLPR